MPKLSPHQTGAVLFLCTRQGSRAERNTATRFPSNEPRTPVQGKMPEARGGPYAQGAEPVGPKEREERREAREEAQRLREELEAERSKGFWRRLFGG